MSLLLPAGLLALGLAVPIVVLHMLTPRRPPTRVSSLLHWDGLRHAITAAEPWQRLRWSLLFILQILAVILFAIALARPAVMEEAALAEHTVFIIDASGSMSAIDGSPDRLGEAISEAKALRADLPDEGVASLVVASHRPLLLLEQSGSVEEFERAVDTLRTVAAAADWEATFALAESLLTPDRRTDIVLISDGQLSETAQRLAPLGTRFQPVGAADTNRAITGLEVEAVPGGLRALVTVESKGGPDASQTLRVDVDGATVASREILSPSGSVIEELFELPAGATVAAFLDGQDLLAYDNQRYATAPTLGDLRVRVFGENTFFVDQLLASIPGIDTDVVAGDEVDLEVYVGVPVPPAPSVPFIAIEPAGGAPGITVTGRIENPVPTLVSPDPLLDDIDFSRIAVAESQVVEVTEGQVLLGAPDTPLIVAGDAAGVPFFYFAFDLERSNLPVDIAYPILGARMVGALTGVSGAEAPLTVGDPIPVGDTGGTVVDPRGNRVVVSVGDSEPVADLSGFWAVRSEGEEQHRIVAVNPDSSESSLRPVSSLPELRPAPGGAETVGATTVARSILPRILGVLLALLALELWVSWRSRGVSDRQWRWGLVARGSIAVLIVLALADPTFATTSTRVTTVFVVDASASVGTAVDTARAWVESAITDAGDNQWAVVEFGEDARVGTPVGTSPYRRARGVEPDATNIARGLRLAEALLGGETRQRIVLVSDGRHNTGDLQAEVDRLKQLGVVVEVHTVAGGARTDAAVAGITAPNTVSEGERFEATVEVVSTIGAELEVKLYDDLGLIGSRVVGVSPGTTEVVFPVEAASPGLQRLRATVSLAGDAVRENNEARTAVQVEGPDTVLVVEGLDGAADPIVEALVSRGLKLDRVDISQMPGLQELGVYRAVLLVNVPARDINESQMNALDSFVRDLGRGMVVVGGSRAYGLGGYRDTPLEALLPVDSEVEDEERKVDVAEVLLIDTSESMGACHCAAPNQEPIEGGVNKTDISKAAAIVAIDALGSGDEVGLLAFSGNTNWVIPLQELPSRETIDEGVASLRPFGETRIVPALREAAAALAESEKTLKHIILFTDGFTSELAFDEVPKGESLIAAAEEVAAQGITISVVATGEGAEPDLAKVAEMGGGRFYPGRDLDEIPEIFVREARIAARTFINEGEFFPRVTSTARAVRDLASSPPLLGYVATTAKPVAQVHLRVGEPEDPLLASWRVGLGKVAAWTSDGGDKWASLWAGWEGFADFWSTVVRDTFPLGGAEGESLEATISDDLLTISLESAEAWPAGTVTSARVSFPGGRSQEVRLERISESLFQATVPARESGTYAVGVSVNETSVLSATASRSFAAEFLPGPPDSALLEGISTATGGRGEIVASQAFDAEGLEVGVTERSYRWWFLLAAALLWPLDVALRRLRLGRRERPSPPR
ncbi:MAG: VWA domain-containing protein [Acidimicrobiia bacterium]